MEQMASLLNNKGIFLRSVKRFKEAHHCIERSVSPPLSLSVSLSVFFSLSLSLSLSPLSLLSLTHIENIQIYPSPTVTNRSLAVTLLIGPKFAALSSLGLRAFNLGAAKESLSLSFSLSPSVSSTSQHLSLSQDALDCFKFAEKAFLFLSPNHPRLRQVQLRIRMGEKEREKEREREERKEEREDKGGEEMGSDEDDDPFDFRK